MLPLNRLSLLPVETSAASHRGGRKNFDKGKGKTLKYHVAPKKKFPWWTMWFNENLVYDFYGNTGCDGGIMVGPINNFLYCSGFSMVRR